MEVVAYLHHKDLLLEDEQGIAVIHGNHYVLSLGDRVFIQQLIDPNTQLYQVQISFACSAHATLHDDELTLRFEGSKAHLQDYLNKTSVHALN